MKENIGEVGGVFAPHYSFPQFLGAQPKLVGFYSHLDVWAP